MGRDPYQMYEELCDTTGYKHDPCVIDVFISITRFMDGDEAKPGGYTLRSAKVLSQQSKVRTPNQALVRDAVLLQGQRISYA